MSPLTVRAETPLTIAASKSYFDLLASLASSLSPAKHSAALSGNNRWRRQRVSFSWGRVSSGPASSKPLKGCSTVIQINVHGKRGDGKGTTTGKIKTLFFDFSPCLFGIEGDHVDERIGSTKDVTRPTGVSRVGGVVVFSGGLYHVMCQDCRGVVSSLVEIEDLVDFRPNLAAVFISKVKSACGVEGDQINRPGLSSDFEFAGDEVLAFDVVDSHLHVFGNEPKSIVFHSPCVKKHLHAGMDVVLGVFQAEINHPHFSFWSHEGGLSSRLRKVPNSFPFAQVPSEVQKKPGFTGEFRFTEDEAGVLAC